MTLRGILKLTVSVVLVASLLWRTPLADIKLIVFELDLISLIVGLLLSFTAWWVSAVRLWFLVPELSLRMVIRMTFVALYYGVVLPGQVAGDLMKAYLLSQAQSSPGQAVGATLVDRAIATVALFSLGACAIPWVQEVPRVLVVVLPLATATILVGLLLLALPRVHALLAGGLWSSQASGARALPRRLVDGLHAVLQHPLRLVVCFVGALVFHGFCVGIHLVLARGFGITLPAATWFLVYAGVSLVTLLPITVAGVGLREGAYVGLLGIFGVGPPQALSISLVLFSYILIGALLGWIIELAATRAGLSR